MLVLSATLGLQGDLASCRLPPVQLPVKGLWVADTSYYCPEDRCISESIDFGRKMARNAVA